MNKRIKTGGRQKGSLNLITKELKNMLLAIIKDELDKLPANLDKLELKDRLYITTRLLPYVLPKQEAIIFQEDEEEIIHVTLNLNN